MQILFDNAWATYLTGQTVSGRLVLNLDESQTIRQIKIKIKGVAEVKWIESERYRDGDGHYKSRDVDYTSDELYFENTIIAVEERFLAAGTHYLDFSTILPPSLPSSFEGAHGHIRYTVKATWDRPWKFDLESKAAFTVIAPVDLNYIPEARLPIRAEDDKTVGCCCCASGPLAVSFDSPYSGVTPGQVLPLTITVENMTNTNTSGGTLKLYKVVTYKGRHPSQRTKEETTEVSKQTLSVIGAHGSNSWSKEISIPPLPATNTLGCSIISIAYEVRVHVPVDGAFRRGMELSARVLIGTIPLAPIAGPVTMPPTSGQLGWSGNNSIPNLPPPTFEQSAFGQATTIHDKDDNEHTQGVGGWVPRYPTYNFTPSAPPSGF